MANTEMPLPLGIAAETGQPLPGIEVADLDALAARERAAAAAPSADRRALEARADAADTAFAVIGELDPNDLAQTGWGVIFAQDADPALQDALKPLLDRRRSQIDDPEKLFKIFTGADGYRPGETAVQWLARRQLTLNVVDPFLGVPFYLVIVGSPAQIPFEFQFTLDMFWAVGRLAFDTPAEYRRYAESVVAYETAAATALPHARQTALFATTHDFDKATQLLTKHVATPLTQNATGLGVLGSRQKFALRPFIGDPATKQTFADILRGHADGLAGRPPALLFTGSHGMELEPNDPQLTAAQGALVCQDWGGFGSIEEQHWFAGGDVPADAQVHGLIHLLFACYGGGCPTHDTFNRLGPAPRPLAAQPFLAKLPQALLAHQNGGALAVLAHVDRAWSYSFMTNRGGGQVQGFRDVLARVMRGDRIGQATDEFNVRWAALSAELSETLHERAAGATIGDAQLASAWVARDDARNYIILGDPAVRLRVEDMPVMAG